MIRDKSKTVYEAIKKAAGGIQFIPKGRKTPIAFDAKRHKIVDGTPEEEEAQTHEEVAEKSEKMRTKVKTKPASGRSRPQAYKEASSTDSETDGNDSDPDNYAGGSLLPARNILQRRDSLGQGMALSHESCFFIIGSFL